MSIEVARSGSELLVNTQVVGSQFDPAITGLAGGGFVATWSDESLTLGDGSATSIKAQVFDAAGAKVGAEFLVNSQVAGAQLTPTITGLANGDFVVAWTDSSAAVGDISGSGVTAQVFTAAGAKVGAEFLVNTSTAGAQQAPTITALAGGGFVVTWTDESHTLGDADGTSIKAQLFTAAGARIGSEFLVNSQVGDSQFEPTVSGLADGGFVVAWRDRSNALGDLDEGVTAQVFDAAGAKVGQEFLVNTEAANPQVQPTITGLAGGGFVVAWSDTSHTLGDPEGASIKLQLFTAAGVEVGSETLVNTQTASDQGSPAVTALAGGGFIVTWEDFSTLGDGDGTSIKAQLFDAGGNKLGGEFLVDTQTTSNQALPTVAAVAGGGFVVAWEDYSRTLGDLAPASIKAQLFALSSVADGHDVTGTQQGDTILVGVGAMATSDGADTVHAGTGADTVAGGAGADQLFGAQGRDLIRGGQGDDLIRGGQGGDFLGGGKGDDRIFGDLGPDTLQGDRGSDTLTGGGGPDRFAFTGVTDGGERDLITDFSPEDRIQLLNGLTITSADSSLDADGDGLRDTVLHFSNGGAVVLSDFTLWSGSLFVV